MSRGSGWLEKTPEFVAARYDRLAPIYGLFEWLYALPLLGIRRKSVDALQLRPGDAVLDVGCGSGRNFDLILQSVGHQGEIFGVDLSAGMLARARGLCERRGWSGVHLVQCHARSFVPPRPIHAAIFSFSYTTMRDRLENLRRVWDLLEPGGRLVITDIALRIGWPRRLLLATSAWVSERTLLGNPATQPWEDLASIAGTIEQQRISFGFVSQYVICGATKPLHG